MAATPAGPATTAATPAGPATMAPPGAGAIAAPSAIGEATIVGPPGTGGTDQAVTGAPITAPGGGTAITAAPIGGGDVTTPLAGGGADRNVMPRMSPVSSALQWKAPDRGIILAEYIFYPSTLRPMIRTRRRLIHAL